jgi:hypothetical protein
MWWSGCVSSHTRNRSDSLPHHEFNLLSGILAASPLMRYWVLRTAVKMLEIELTLFLCYSGGILYNVYVLQCWWPNVLLYCAYLILCIPRCCSKNRTALSRLRFSRDPTLNMTYPYLMLNLTYGTCPRTHSMAKFSLPHSHITLFLFA